MNADRRPPQIPITQIPPPRRSPFRRWSRWLVVLLLLPVLALAAYFGWTYHGAMPPTEIYQGITYSCEQLPDGPDSGGLLHLTVVDLTAPGISFYITPLDLDALEHGWQYQLAYVSTVVRREDLAVAVNGTLYRSDSPFIRLPGQWANSSETLVADHVTSHIDPNSYLMWWDDQLIAHLDLNKPPTPAVLARAKWAIGGQMAVLFDGHPNYWAGPGPDHRTMIAANPQQKRVWLACFDKASYHYAAQLLAEKGATIGILVDGGISTSMAIGREATGVQAGRVVGGLRPVATQFGFRALPLH